MDMETGKHMYPLGKLHKAQERPLYGGISAGGVICHRACMMTPSPQTGDMQMASEALSFSPEPQIRSLCLIYLRNTNWRRRGGGLGCFL